MTLATILIVAAHLTLDHTYVRQLADRSCALSMLDCTEETEEETAGTKPKPKRKPPDPAELKHRRRCLREVYAIIAREVRRFTPGNVAVVCQLRIRRLLEEMGGLPPAVEFRHFNATTGMNDLKDIRLMIVIGRTLPGPAVVEAMAEAATGRPVQRLDGWYPKADAFREMRDGSMVPCEADRHPDPVAEGFRRGICETGIVQAAGRGRAPNRTAEDPLDILLLTEVPVPIPDDELVTWEVLRPNAEEMQHAAHGIVFRCAAHAARTGWKKADAVRQEKKRERERYVTFPYQEKPIGECHTLPGTRLVRYQLVGQGERAAEAVYDPALIVEPKAAIEAAHGELATFELVQPEPIAEPVSQQIATTNASATSRKPPEIAPRTWAPRQPLPTPPEADEPVFVLPPEFPLPWRWPPPAACPGSAP